MMNIVRARMRKDEDEGFTLIELLVVVLILGILMAIAIPTFLSLTGGAKTSAAEADMTTGAQDEATYFTQNGTYDLSAATNVADMKAVDPGLNWVATTPGTAGTKSIAVVWKVANGATAEVQLVTKGQDGNTYFIDDDGGTLLYAYTTGATPVEPTYGIAGGDWVSSWKSLPTTVPTT